MELLYKTKTFNYKLLNVFITWKPYSFQMPLFNHIALKNYLKLIIDYVETQNSDYTRYEKPNPTIWKQ